MFVKPLAVACKLNLVVFVLLFLQGCSIIAPYDEKTEEAIFNASKLVDQFYGTLQETDADQRKYQKFSERYVLIESELNSLVLRNAVRAMNEDSTDIAERILKLWKKYKERHKKKDSYSTGMARLDRKRFMRMFSYAVRAEGAKKPPEHNK